MEPLVSCMPGKCFTSDFHIKAFVSAFYLEVGSHLHRLVLSLLCSSTGLKLSSEQLRLQTYAPAVFFFLTGGGKVMLGAIDTVFLLLQQSTLEDNLRKERGLSFGSGLRGHSPSQGEGLAGVLGGQSGGGRDQCWTVTRCLPPLSHGKES